MPGRDGDGDGEEPAMAPDGAMQAGFIARHGLWDETQRAAAREVLQRVRAEGLETVRLSFADQHGILRGKSVVAEALPSYFESGCNLTITLLAKDTAHRTVYPVWQAGRSAIAEMTGAGDIVMVPDPSSFRVLPWTERTGWLLCDIHHTDGRPVSVSTRALCRDVLARLAQQGYALKSGLEVEFHLYRLEDPKLRPEHATQPGEPPATSLLAQGFQYLTESRLDELEPLLELLRRQLLALGLPLRSLEVEFGPGQVELTFEPLLGLETADAMVLFRSAVKQICRRHGYHATFMCRPGLPNAFSSGWHLHQSLVEKASGVNAFIPVADDPPLSEVGRQYVAGLLAHARAACVFTTPTLNGYKRYRPFSLAPDRVLWGRDNRGAMLRVIGGPGDPATRVENRVGEPAANPYLYLASQAQCGLTGLARGLVPDSPADAPYETAAEVLPKSLMEALAALRDDGLFAAAWGQDFIDYILTIKQAEIDRFLAEVTDWEQREYFGVF